MPKSKFELEVISFSKAQKLKHPSKLLKYPLGIKFISIGILVDASSPNSHYHLSLAKHPLASLSPKHLRSKAKPKITHGPLTVVVENLKRITKIIDLTRIDPSIKPVIKNPPKLASRIEGKYLVRIPVIKKATINQVLLDKKVISQDSRSQPWIQFIYFGQDQPQVHRFFEKIYKLSGILPAGSSMNIHGQPTITDLDQAIVFCKQKRIPKFIHDHTSPRQGSYPIVVLGKVGITPPNSKQLTQPVSIIRAGNFSTSKIKSLWPEVFKSKKSPI